MAYDAGTAVGRFELDISDVNSKTAQINADFMEIAQASDKVVQSVQNQAQAFNTVLGKAYDSLESQLTPMQQAQKSIADMYVANRQKVAMFAQATQQAAQAQKQAHETTAKSMDALVAAYDEVIAKRKAYEESSQLKYASNWRADLDKYVEAMRKQEEAQQAYNVAKSNEEAITQQATQAQKAYEVVLKSVATSEQQAQQAMAKFTAENAKTLRLVNAERLQDSEKVRQANAQETSERKRQLEEIQRAMHQEANAEKEAQENRVLAFAVAAKAVDELVNGVKRLTQEMINLSKEVLDIGADFETSMAQVAATSGMTATDVSTRISEYQDLVDAAKEAGLTTIFSASQAGEALNYLALAGYNVEQSIETMPDILTIAAAGAMDLGRASDMVTDAMNALDLGIGNTSDFIDKMAKTAQSSNTNVEQLGNAILTVGGTATVLSGGVTELDTALGLLANSGIKARVGGTALRQILLNLTAPAKQGAEMIEKLGLQVFDLEGNMRPLKDIFKDLDAIMADFSDQQRMETLNAIFDARQIRSANALLQASGEAWDNLEAKIENSEGAAEKMAETMRSNLNGALNIAQSNLDAIAITLYEGVQKNITDLVESAVPKFQELNKVLASPEVQARLHIISEEVKKIGLNLLDGAVKALPEILKTLPSIDTALKSLAITIGALTALKIASKADTLLLSLINIAKFVATNPYAIVAVAIAGIVVALMNLIDQIKKAKEAAVEAAQAERDVWSEQRTSVQGVVDEWNEYKETAQETAKTNQDHADSIKALYEEYKILNEEGEDTTLVLQALAKEVPEVSKLIDEGTTSYEAITQAVDDYVTAIEKEALVEAYKANYMQAITTRTKLSESVDELKQNMIDSGLAAEQAKISLDRYKEKYGEPLFGDKKKELDRLEAEYEAANNIYAANVNAYEQANSAYIEAGDTAEKAREDFAKVLQGDIDKELGLVEDGSNQMVNTYATAGESLKKANEKSKAQFQKQTQDTVDTIKAELEKLDADITIGDANEYDKIDLFKRYFGEGFDDKQFDRTNKDIVAYYGEYQKLIAKKEKELNDQLEKDRKDREKLAKDEADKLKKSIDKSVSDIDWYASLSGATAEEHADKLRKFIEDNASYYQAYPDEYEKMVQKIANLDKQWVSNTKLTQDELEKYLKKIEGFYGKDSDIYKTLTEIVSETEQQRNKEVAEEYFKNWTDGYNKLADKASKAYQDIEKSRDSFEKNLLSGVELFSESNEKVWNRFSQQYEDQKGMVVDKKAYRDATKQLQDLQKTMDSLQAKGLDEGILNELWGMSPEEALEKANELNKFSTSSIGQLNADYQAYITQAEGMTQKYYDAQVKDWEEKYWNPLVEYTKTGQADLKNAMALVGEDTVNGFIEGLESNVEKADEGTKQLMTDVLNMAKETLGIHSPSTEFFEIGENVIQGFLNGIQSKAEMLTNIFVSLGQKAGDSFVNAFRETWENFVALWNTSGVVMPQAMIATAYGTPAFAGGQMVYNGIGATTSTGLTRDDVTAAVKDALPSGNVVLQVDKSTFGIISREALNSVAENSEMGLKV